jgi:hypothetical protein
MKITTNAGRTGIRLPFVAIVAALSLSIWPALAQATPNPKGPKAWENHCLTPFGGYKGGEFFDLNELFGRTEAFVHPRFCPEVDAGERWIVGRGCVAFWITHTEHGNYPPGYVPSGATPMADFLSKLTVKVVVDPGTKHERTHLYRYADDPGIAMTIPLGENPVGAPEDLPIASLIPRNRPLPIGTHVVDVYVIMSADHWDGLGTDPEFNLLPAGERLVTAGNRFEVVPRSRSVSQSG